MNRNRRIGLVVAVVVLAMSGAWAFVRFAYTPTTTALVVNDTSGTVTLDQCADAAVTLAPGARRQVTPFRDGSRNGCRVFIGKSDLTEVRGCVEIGTKDGQTVSGEVSYVSSMRSMAGSTCG